MMKIILAGYPGSQHLVPVSKYLANKYLPGFDFHYLNWEGNKNGWSEFVADYLRGLDDRLIIFALDDYLLNSPINKEIYESALEKFERGYENMACVKLHRCSLEEHLEYPVTTQYTIWNRKMLIRLLNMTKDPWHFEMIGSSIFRALEWNSVHLYPTPALEYNTSSALSPRWQGIKWDGVKQEDIDYIKNNKLI